MDPGPRESSLQAQDSSASAVPPLFRCPTVQPSGHNASCLFALKQNDIYINSVKNIIHFKEKTNRKREASRFRHFRLKNIKNTLKIQLPLSASIASFTLPKSSLNQKLFLQVLLLRAGLSCLLISNAISKLVWLSSVFKTISFSGGQSVNII